MSKEERERITEEIVDNLMKLTPEEREEFWRKVSEQISTEKE